MSRNPDATDLWGPDPITPAEAERIRSAAGALERFALATNIAPRAGLAASIMASLDAEPAPAPLVVLSTAARHGRLAVMASAIRDAWRVAWSGGRPTSIRLTAAMAILLLVVATGSVGGAAAVAAWNALEGPSPTPAPSPLKSSAPVVLPRLAPSPSPSPAPTHGPVTSPTPGVTATPSPSSAPSHSPRPTPKPTHKATPRPTMAPTHHPGATPMPTPMPTHHPSSTAMATHHPEPSHGVGHG